VTAPGREQHPNVQLQIVATEPSLTFYDPAEVEAAGSRRGKTAHVWRDSDEWQVGGRPSPSAPMSTVMDLTKP
jgi:hypothetical protein